MTDPADDAKFVVAISVQEKSLKFDARSKIFLFTLIPALKDFVLAQ